MCKTIDEPKARPDVGCTELLALKIRNLIAEREMNTAQANRELAVGGDWLWDHGEHDRVLAVQIEELFQQANADWTGAVSEPNAGMNLSGDEPEYAPRACWVCVCGTKVFGGIAGICSKCGADWYYQPSKPNASLSIPGGEPE